MNAERRGVVLDRYDVCAALVGGVTGLLVIVLVLLVASRLGIARAVNEMHGGISQLLRGR